MLLAVQFSFYHIAGGFLLALLLGVLLAALSAIDLQMNAEEAEKQEDPAVKTGGTYE